MDKKELRKIIREELAQLTESVGGNLYNSIEDLRYTIHHEISNATGGNISKKDVTEMSKELMKFEKYLKRKLKGKGLIGW